MRKKDFTPEQDESYITQEMLAYAACSPPTLIKWIQEWQVDGKAIGYKRGGRWVINISRLRKFLKGQGKPLVDRPRKIGNKKSRKDRTDCAYYNSCLEAAAMSDSQNVGCSTCPDFAKERR